MRAVNGFLEKAVWAFIPGLVFLFCPWFAGVMTTGITEVSYDVNKTSINGLTSIHLKLTNIDNTSAVDILELYVPNKDRLFSALSLKKSDTKVDNWKGSLGIGESIDLLLVLSSDINVDQKYVNSIFKGKYQVRDENTGKQKWVDIKLAEKGMIAINKSTLFAIWYVVPIIVSIILIAFAIRLMNRNDSEQ
ncbi:hypothetical protein AB3A53_004385 [Vibrio vulnificus]